MRTNRNNRPRRPRRREAVLLAGAYLIALAVNRSLVAVRGPSMLPGLWPGDRVLTVPAIGTPRPGAVVVVRDPGDASHLVVKRVHRVEATGVDVRGDHAVASTDSRQWGPLPRDAVQRRVVARWPDLRSRL